MAEMEATPRPWTVSDYFKGVSFVVGADGYTVAHVEQFAILDGYMGKLRPVHVERPSGESRANAELIVRAVNAHAKLIEALEEIKSTSSSVPIGVPELQFRERQMAQVISIATRALALARGEVSA